MVFGRAPENRAKIGCRRSQLSPLSRRCRTAPQRASERAIAAYQAWRAAGGSSQTRGAVDEALEAAETADDDVIELIRTGLQGRGKGRPLPDWQPTTAGWT